MSNTTLKLCLFPCLIGASIASATPPCGGHYAVSYTPASECGDYRLDTDIIWSTYTGTAPTATTGTVTGSLSSSGIDMRIPAWGKTLEYYTCFSPNVGVSVSWSFGATGTPVTGTIANSVTLGTPTGTPSPAPTTMSGGIACIPGFDFSQASYFYNAAPGDVKQIYKEAYGRYHLISSVAQTCSGVTYNSTETEGHSRVGRTKINAVTGMTPVAGATVFVKYIIRSDRTPAVFDCVSGVGCASPALVPALPRLKLKTSKIQANGGLANLSRILERDEEIAGSNVHTEFGQTGVAGVDANGDPIMTTTITIPATTSAVIVDETVTESLEADGDVNGDGVIDRLDRLAFVAALGQNLTTASFTLGADLHTDGVIQFTNAGGDSDWLALGQFTSTLDCVADIGSAGGVTGPDGLLDNNDWIVFMNEYFAGSKLADMGIAGGLLGVDEVLDNNDWVAFTNDFYGNPCGL